MSLLVWIADIDGNLIVAFGLKVYDDAAAPGIFFGSCRSDEETADLRQVLAAGTFPVQIHNENLLPQFYAECRFDPTPARKVLAFAPSPADTGHAGFQLREKANDAVEEALEGNDEQRIKASCELPLAF